MNYVLIGDVHSQAKNLESALSFIRKNIKDSKVIFLGDLFDTKNSYSDSHHVYELVREAENDLNAIILQSNHQDKLIRHLKGNNIDLNNGLDKTISDLSNHSVSFEELFSWLIHQPFGVAFKDKFDCEFRCAHAYFNEEVNVSDYKEIHKVWALNRVHKHQFLYGIQDEKRNRINWWDRKVSHQSFIRVAGHYKTIYVNFRNKSIVLDSCCGDSNGVLSIYDVNSRKIHQF